MKWQRKGNTGGREAREAAEAQLEEVRARRHESRRVAESLKSRVERNHIADGLRLIYLGGNE